MYQTKPVITFDRGIVVLTWLLSILLMLPASVLASVVINGTRIVFPSNERETTVRLTNEGEAPGLVQTWLDDGDENADPESIKVPFVLTPPLARIDPGKGQSIRMLYDGTPLSQDRESLYWFNVLEIPPKPNGEAAERNYMQIALRTRIKVFFRPAALNSQTLLDDAHKQLDWSLSHHGGANLLRFDNPTPYHLSVIKAVLLNADGKEVAVGDEGKMAAPYGHAQFRLSDSTVLPAGLRVRYTFLNDFGAPVQKEAEVSLTAK